MDVSHQDEKLKMEQERECYKTEVEQLRGDLEVTRIESAKEGTRKSEKVCCYNACGMGDCSDNNI